jgi:two-component system, cell cycle sensor histidine kinase and response regulator CckA
VLQVPDVNGLPAEAACDREVLQLGSVGSIILLPLRREGQPFGFLAYSVTQKARTWSEEEIELLKLLRDVMASALVRSWADAALRKSESRLNFLVASSPVIIHTREVQPPHTLRYISPNVQPLMGLNPDAFLDRTDGVCNRVHPEERERVAVAWPQVLERDELRLEYRLRTGDDQYRWVQEQSRLVRDASGQPQEIIGYWMDITERKQYEAELSAFNHELEQRVEAQTRDVLASERLAQATLDALSARVVILDEQGNIVAANRAWCAFYGGRTPSLVGNYLHYCEHLDRTSERDPVSHLAPGLRAVLAGAERSQVQEYGQVIDGVMNWFVCRIERFGSEEAPRVVVSHEDITALKQAERAQLRSQRLESLGTLAGGVAHDLNNALAPVLMGMSILKEEYPRETKLFNMIEASAQRGTDMVRQLLTFARGAEGERVAVCPGSVVHELERLMKGSFPKSIELQIVRPEGLPAVVGDPTQLHQVLLNLCVNARDAMPGGGTLALGLQEVELDAVYARAIPDAVPGRYVALRVSDTGSGIAPEILDRIFDPFFTTKAADKGTGLGLSTVLGIVKGHGGFVQVYSQPGEGTIFTVYLPVAPSDAGAAVPATAVETPEAGQGHGETVLFVDDEAAVREVGRTVLERLNYQVLLATDGADGLVRAAEHRHALRAVITDLHMPHMDGLAFVRALRRTLPNVPVVVASGRVDEAAASELLRLGVTRRLDKPFTQAQLARELRELLASR